MENLTVYENETTFLTIKNKTMQVDNFLTTESVHCQRLEEPRHKPLKKILSEKLLPTHLEVSLIKVHFEDEYYRMDGLYSINGNTRKYIWTRYPELKPEHNLHVTVYNAFNRLDVEHIYRSIDSGNSVETVNQMMTGHYRSFKFTPISKKFKAGNIGTALKHAYVCCTGSRRMYGNDTSLSDLKNKKEFIYFEEELKYLDVFYHNLEKDKVKHKKLSTGCILASLLILGKKYGVNSPKFGEMVNNLFNQVTKIGEGVNGWNDGIKIIWSDLYDKYNPDGHWTDQSEGNGPTMIGKIIYCMDAFMNDEPLKTRNSSSLKGIVINDVKSVEYFRNYFA